MARESCSIKVKRQDEEFMIESYQKFGWELLSSQDVVSQTLHDGFNGGIETNTYDYVKLIFSREKKMEHYAEIVELEREFRDIEEPELKLNKFFFGTAVVTGILGVLGFLALLALSFFSVLPMIVIGGFSFPELLDPLSSLIVPLILTILFIPITVGLGLISSKINKGKKQEYEEELALVRKRQTEILEEVEQYL